MARASLISQPLQKNTVFLQSIKGTSDERYAKLQEDIREGKWTYEYIDVLNERFGAVVVHLGR